MRTTQDLIAELAHEAERLTSVALVIGFEEHTKFVFYAPDADEQLLTELNGLIQEGGEPIGFVGFILGEGEGRFYQRAVVEYASEPWVEPYLTKLAARVREQMIAKGIRADWVHPERN